MFLQSSAKITTVRIVAVVFLAVVLASTTAFPQATLAQEAGGGSSDSGGGDSGGDAGGTSDSSGSGDSGGSTESTPPPPPPADRTDTGDDRGDTVTERDDHRSQDGEDGTDGSEGTDGTDGGDTAPDTTPDGEDGGDENTDGDSGGDGTENEDGGNGGDAPDAGDGGNGNTGGTGTSTDDNTTTIETGDAEAHGDIQNNVNTNETGAGDGVPPEEPPSSDGERPAREGEDGRHDGHDASEPHDEGEADRHDGHRTPVDVEVENNNDGTIENELGVDANTGENAITDSENARIRTGDAIATANIINALNTNIFNSSGFFLFLNNFFDLDADVDLRSVDWLAPEANGGAGCGIYECELIRNLTLFNSNVASITNNVVVRSSTGGNEAQNNGTSEIETGNAYAAANVVNIANTNIVDSNYLLLAFNNFGDWAGDLVFPAHNFFEDMFGTSGSAGCSAPGSVNIENNNTSTVESDVSAESDSGENTIEGTEDSSISTGDAGSSVAITNTINTNLLCDTSLSVLFQIHGTWSGNVFSAPDGVYWTETANGIQIFGDGLQDPEVGEELAAGDLRHGGRDAQRGGSVNIENSNDANIQNSVRAIALTGDNRIEGGESGSINTGNAYAAANVFNVANTNVVGKNWLLAVVNIFGDWEGNIAFGRPDLWIGEVADLPQNPALPGDTITYTFTVMNNGDVPANEVLLKDTFNGQWVSPSGGSYNESGEGSVAWNLGRLAPGEAREASYQVTVSPNVPYGETNITNVADVSSYEDDEDYADNVDELTIVAFNPPPPPPAAGGGSSGGSSGGSGDGGGSGGDPSGGDAAVSNTQGSSGGGPAIVVTKSNNADGPIKAGDSVDYRIVIRNDDRKSGDDAVLLDTLKDEDGNVIHQEEWDLDAVFAEEEIVITYTIEFEDDAVSGTYMNTAELTISNGHRSTYSASSDVEVVGTEKPEEPQEESEQEILITTAPPSGGTVTRSDGGASSDSAPEFSVGEGEAWFAAPANETFTASIARFFTGWLGLFFGLALFGLVIFLYLLRKREEETAETHGHFPR